MSLQMVRFHAADEDVSELETQVGLVMSALGDSAPQGFTYRAFRRSGGSDFVFIAEVADQGDNPLLRLPEATALRELISRAASGPVPPEPFDLVGAYPS